MRPCRRSRVAAPRSSTAVATALRPRRRRLGFGFRGAARRRFGGRSGALLRPSQAAWSGRSLLAAIVSVYGLGIRGRAAGDRRIPAPSIIERRSSSAMRPSNCSSRALDHLLELRGR